MAAASGRTKKSSSKVKKSAKKPASKSPPGGKRNRKVSRVLSEKAGRPIQAEVQAVLSSLTRMSTKRDRENLARFGITAGNSRGVSMANIKLLAKPLGKNHELAAELWSTGVYEARMLTSFVDEPARVTPAQMDRWAKDFDNWGICDTVCFHLFDRTPHAWVKVAKWSGRREEFVKRAAFALLASLALHDKTAADESFLRCLPLIEREADDDRKFVKKGVSWALRAIGGRSAALNLEAATLARRLSASPHSAARWIGRDALRDITRPVVLRRIAARQPVQGK